MDIGSERVAGDETTDQLGTASLNDSTPLEAALWLAERGIFVLPLHPLTDDGACTCREGAKCRKPGKHPLSRLVPHGHDDATTNPAIIRRWWTEQTSANIGIALQQSGLVVVDFDSPVALRHFGMDLPPTFTVESGPGHRHYYYRLPAGCPATCTKCGDECEILADGHTVVPPSRHHSGRHYRVVRDVVSLVLADLPEPPRWVVGELEDAAERRQAKAAVEFTDDAASGGEAAYRRVASRLPDDIRRLIEGGHEALPATAADRSGTDWRVAKALVKAGLSDDEVRAVFQHYPIGTKGKYADRGDDYLAHTLRKVKAQMGDGQEEHLGEDGTPEAAAKPPSDVTRTLITLADGVELFHTPEGESFARVPVDGHLEVHQISGGEFRKWLRWRAHKIRGLTPSREQVDRAIEQLSAKAEFAGPELPVALRVARHGGNIYIDLGNAAWEVVEVTPDRWQVRPAAEVPVRFRRSKAMQALPRPQEGGDLKLLRRHVNVDDASWPLLVGWLLMALHPMGPYPVLNLRGEQGSAKSTAAKMLRRLTDPSSVPSRGEPKGDDELRAAVVNNWVVVLDNLSHVPGWMSDALCRISTEGGFATRVYYTNNEETAIQARRPVIITAITDVVTRPDLADRGLFVTLPSLQDRWLDEEEVWRAFEEDAPLIFGALLEALSEALRREAETPPSVRCGWATSPDG